MGTVLRMPIPRLGADWVPAPAPFGGATGAAITGAVKGAATGAEKGAATGAATGAEKGAATGAAAAGAATGENPTGAWRGWNRAFGAPVCKIIGNVLVKQSSL